MPLDDHDGSGAAGQETFEEFDMVPDELSAAKEQKKKEIVHTFSFGKESAE